MASFHSFTRFPRSLFAFAVFATGLAWEADAGGAPPNVIAVFSGQWTGEGTRTLSGEETAESSSNARRYWTEGAIVRGEVLSSAGGRLETARVAILPRDFGFLKILTIEGDAPEVFIGTPAEGGLLWTSVASEGIRYIERVMGTGESRRFEILLVEPPGEQLRVVQTLQPSEDALTGVIGDSVQSVEEIEPLVLPPMAEMRLLDRIGWLLLQRDTARVDSGAMARELAAAWRQNERLEAELAFHREEQSRLPGDDQTEDSGADAIVAQLSEARLWADQLEKSLREESERADAAEVRVAQLESELVHASSERDQLRENLGQRIAEAGERDDSLRAMLEEALAGRERVEQELAAVSDRAASLAEENERLGAETAVLVEVRESNARLEGQIAEFEARLGTMVPADEAARLSEEVDRLVATLASVEENLVVAESELAASRIESESLASETAALRDDLQAAQEKAAERTAALERLQSTVAGHATARAEIAALQERLQAQTDAAAQRESLAAAQLGELEEQVESLSVQLSETATARDEAVAELQSARERLVASESRIEELDGRIVAADQSEVVSDLQAALVEAREERDALAGNNSELEASIAALRAELTAARTDLAGMREQVGSLEAAAAASPADERVDELESRLAETFARAERRQEEIDTLNAEVVSLEAENRKLVSRVAELAARIASEHPGGADLAGSSLFEQVQRQLAEEQEVRRKAEAERRALAVQLRELEIQLAEARNLEDAPATAPPSATAPPAGTVTVAAATPPAALAQSASIAVSQARAAPGRPVEERAATGTAPEEPRSAAVSYRPSSAASSGDFDALRRPPRRPDEPAASLPPGPGGGVQAVGRNAFLVQVVRGLPVNGYRQAAADSLVVISGRTYGVGQIVDPEHGIRFQRIDSDSIVFTAPDGGEYRFNLR